MGVDIRKIVAGEKIGIDKLKNKTLAFDAFNMTYQFLASVRQYDGTPLMDSNNNITSHLSGLFYRNAKFIEQGLKLIYVFDGVPPEIKHRILRQRKQRKQKAAKELEKAIEKEQLDKMRKLSRQTLKLTDEMIYEAKILLRAMGIPVVEAPSEGEAQAAFMAMKGYAYASVSQDYDSLLFGAPRLIRNLSITGKRRHVRGGMINIEPEQIILASALKQMKISRKQLIWLGILVGTDFNEGVKGIGPKKGLKIVQQCTSLEQVIKTVRYKKEYDFPEDVKQIYNFFMNPPVTENFDIRWPQVDQNQVIKLLVDKHDFSYDRIKSALEKVCSATKQARTQGALTDYL